MSRTPLRPLNLNQNQKLIKATSVTSRTRPSMSQNVEMAKDSFGPSPCGLNSPMTNLAMNLSELSTGRSTPKRRLSLSSIDTPPSDSSRPSTDRSSSTESGVFSDSPTPSDSPTLESLYTHRYRPNIPIEAFTKKKTIAFRKIGNLPPITLRLDNDSPTEFLEGSGEGIQTDHYSSCSSDGSNSGLHKPVFFMEEDSSQDSGVSLEKDFEFKCPAPVSGTRRRSSKLNEISEETCSPHKYSPVKSPNSRALSFSIKSFGSSNSDGDSLVQLKCSSLTSSEGDDDDDGFLDLVDQEVSEINDQVPESLSGLFNEPLINRPRPTKSSVDNDDTPNSRRTMPLKRFLHRSQSVVLQSRLKRSDSSSDEIFSVQNKRWKSEQCHDDSSQSLMIPREPPPRLHRCHSETEAIIKSAVSRMAEEPDLIGDCSRPYILPTLRGKHQDLKSISPETLSRLIGNEFQDHVEKFHIIDCRYPYEFLGGHIMDAKNLYTKDSILEEYMKNPVKTQDPSKRFILIFHCEFSSERGPNLFRFLRSRDRMSNKECYPFLHYPEIYLLEGGYKAFFEEYKDLCVPQNYKQMLHKDHSDDLRMFRAKSKSWAGEKSNSRTGLRNLKF